MGTKPDNLESRKKKLQTEDKVADENPKGKISDTLEGTFFDLNGSEFKGYSWTCPMCKSSNTKSKNLSKRKGVLSFSCPGCKHAFDVVAEETQAAQGSDELNTDHWGITLSDGVPEFRLGNWTTDGWHWDGGPEMMLMFLARMMSDLPELMAHVHGHPAIFSALTSEFEKAKANQEALVHLGYVLTGDNQVWHFGGVEDLLSQDLDQDLENFEQGMGESIKEQVLADPAFTWAESLSDEQLKEACISAYQHLTWTPGTEETDQICLEMVNDCIQAGYLDLKDLDSFINSLIEFPSSGFEENRYEIWDEWGNKILDPQWDSFIADIKKELLQYKEDEGTEAPPPPVGPNQPKLPLSGSRASKQVAKSVPTRTINIGGTPTKLSLVPGDLRRKDVLKKDVATCGACGRSWDDGQSTSCTPAPSGRCPFEYEHREAKTSSEASSNRRKVVKKVATFPFPPFSEEEKAQIGSGYKKEPEGYDVVGQMIAYEQGDLDENETIDLFQNLIDSGLVWKLQGHYGRSAKAYLDAGLCHLPENHPTKAEGTAQERVRELNSKSEFKAPQHISTSKSFQAERQAGALVPVSRKAYSAFIRTLDHVQEVPSETPKGQSIKIVRGAKVLAEAFYPKVGDPMYGVVPGIDDSEEPDHYLNHYRCPEDGTEWEDASPYTNNDRCPTCNKEIEPYESEDI